MNKGDTQEAMSVDEVASQFHVRPATIYRWIKDGIVSPPDQEWRGTRPVYRFTPAWMERAESEVQKSRNTKSNNSHVDS